MTQQEFDEALEAIRNRYKYQPDETPEIWTCKRGSLMKIWTCSQIVFAQIIEVLGGDYNRSVMVVTESFRGMTANVILYTLHE